MEQEVDGDETSALESVLECDEERAALLRKEKQLLASNDESSSDLAQVGTARADICNMCGLVERKAQLNAYLCTYELFDGCKMDVFCVNYVSISCWYGGLSLHHVTNAIVLT